jgi:hypothetical protein
MKRSGRGQASKEDSNKQIDCFVPPSKLWLSFRCLSALQSFDA